MVDRASTFADPDILTMLRDDFVPVAIDQWYERRQQDDVGEFWRKVAGQGPRNDFQRTTQGRYICAPDGTLLAYNNNRGPERIRAAMREALAAVDSTPLAAAEPLTNETPDARFVVDPPDGAMVVRVHAKVLGGYEATEEWTSVFHDAIGRDNAWWTVDEQAALVEAIRMEGAAPEAWARRFVRFHFVDHTRGEPTPWAPGEIRSVALRFEAGVLRGAVHLETADGSRGYQAEVLARVAHDGGALTQFDLVATGSHWGHGRYTGHAPPGRFPLAITARLADGSELADALPPHGTKGWPEGYFR